MIWVPETTNNTLYQSLCPKELTRNLAFRKELLDSGYERPAYAEELIELCSRDPLFFINGFCWLLEARESAHWQVGNRLAGERIIPFITRSYQSEKILEAVEFLGKRDIIIEKSRETGVTWMFIALAAWDWMFHDQTHILFASKDENTVDNPRDPDSLMSKLQFLLDRMPIWMLGQNDYERTLADHSFLHRLNGSSIVGYAAQAELGRGGRKKWALMDEFHFFPPGDDDRAMESTRGTTHCRVLVSTVNRKRGESGQFALRALSNEFDQVKIIIDWKDDPDKRAGLYTSDRIGESDTFELRILDEAYWNRFAREDGTYREPNSDVDSYRFILDGKVRSPYYDHEWRRGTPAEIAAELDRQFGSAAARVCDEAVIQLALTKVRDPFMCVDVRRKEEQDDRSYYVDPDCHGALELWLDHLEDGKPPRDVYAMGQDVSAGTGGAYSSYSYISIWRKRDAKQVGQWRSNRFDPLEFAEISVAIGKWFHNAFMTPELNGPLGQLFMNRVTDMGYWNLFQPKVRSEDVNSKRSNKYGYNNADGGNFILVQLVRAMAAGTAHPMSRIALNEMQRYIYVDGKCTHSSLKSEQDHGARGKAHGDAAIGLAVGYHGLLDLPDMKTPEKTSVVTPGSFLDRLQKARDKATRTGHSLWDNLR